MKSANFITRYFSFMTMMEGLFFAIMVATSESYALYYFTKNGLSTLDIALLSTIPLFAASSMQLIYPRLIKDKFLTVGISIAYALQLLGLAGIIYCAWIQYSFLSLLISLTCYWVGGQNSAPLLMDWFSRFIPGARFGGFLSTRNIVIAITTLAIYIVISLKLNVLEAFKYVFVVGFAARSFSIVVQVFLFIITSLMNKDPLIEAEKKHYAETHPISASSLKVLFTFFFWTAIFRIAVNLSSPFFLPYMVNDLKMDIKTYVFLTAIPLVGRALFLHNWGKSSQGFRPFWGIQVTCLVVSTLPFLWTLNNNIYWLAFVQILSGIFWGGLEISNIMMVQNVAYNRARSLLGLHQALMTFCSIIGSLLGAYILTHHPGDYHLNFNLSSFLRFIVAALFIAHISYMAHFKYFRHFKLSPRIGRMFLYSLLTIRPSLANVGRITPFPRLKKAMFGEGGKRKSSL